MIPRGVGDAAPYPNYVGAGLPDRPSFLHLESW